MIMSIYYTRPCNLLYMLKIEHTRVVLLNQRYRKHFSLCQFLKAWAHRQVILVIGKYDASPN